jgi:hypothetical protein
VPAPRSRWCASARRARTRSRIGRPRRSPGRCWRASRRTRGCCCRGCDPAARGAARCASSSAGRQLGALKSPASALEPPGLTACTGLRQRRRAGRVYLNATALCLNRRLRHRTTLSAAPVIRAGPGMLCFDAPAAAAAAAKTRRCPRQRPLAPTARPCPREAPGRRFTRTIIVMGGAPLTRRGFGGGGVAGGAPSRGCGEECGRPAREGAAWLIIAGFAAARRPQGRHRCAGAGPGSSPQAAEPGGLQGPGFWRLRSFSRGRGPRRAGRGRVSIHRHRDRGALGEQEGRPRLGAAAAGRRCAGGAKHRGGYRVERESEEETGEEGSRV